MNTTKNNVVIGHLGLGQSETGFSETGFSVAGYLGFQAWRVRPTTLAKSALGSPVMTDATVTKPATKPLLVSASERCP
jgi:hypothetical protein